MAQLTPDAPTVLVVFGATGDLMDRKIVPALFYLHEKGRLPERMRVIGVARRPLADDAFRDQVAESVRSHRETRPPAKDVTKFTKVFSYSQGQFDDVEAYGRLLDTLAAIDDEWKVCANKLFYLAVPPSSYSAIFNHLSESGLATPCGGAGGWTRVLVEKPFGRDAETAQALDEQLGKLFEESQIYRIDHYLAKEMLQGIMAFRFSNNLLEPSWDNRAIDHIEVDLLETLGVEDRGEFYDGVGALRDVGQNHLLQMLALATMAQPAGTDADAIRAQRVAALRALTPMTEEQVRRSTFRAQFDGFRDVPGVAPDSKTETFFKVATHLDSPDWDGVPVILQGGKRVGTVRKHVVMYFKSPEACLCPPDAHVQNWVDFCLEPLERITIGFWTKKPGFEEALEQRDFNFFLYEKEDKAQYVEEYAKLLDDAIRGDQMLFVSTREVRAMWEFIDPIYNAWGNGAVSLERYKPGSDDVLKQAESVGARAASHAGMRREIGVVGLGKMGGGIAHNLKDHGWRVVAYNRTAEVAMEMEPEGFIPAYSLAEMVAALEPPRTVWLMVPAGAPVEEVLFGAGGLADGLETGDTVIDGGNSRYQDAAERHRRLAEKGIRFIDCGVSGGPSGARHGACLLVGGERSDFERLTELWRDLSVDGGYRHFEGIGAGHFVKMVHNGIEYGMMQAIAEGFTILRDADYSLDLTDAADVFNHGSVVESRLIAWLDRAFRLHGEDLGGVSGSVASTGEAGWTVEAAQELGVQVRVIEEAVKFRAASESMPDWTGQVLSALREQFGGHPIG